MTPDNLSTSARSLANDFKLVHGELKMPKGEFSKWQKVHSTLQGEHRKERRIELIAIALRFRTLGVAAREALAQLVELTADLMVEPTVAGPAAPKKVWGKTS